MPEKLKMHSPDLVGSNIDCIAELFPNCVTEAAGENGQVTRKIDFDLLRQELSDEIVEGPLERYHLNWPGKREAMLAANAPISKTLRPCREESVDFDTTQNLFIEGDNLEALKLLQETYLGKVKMIYIDPPYNTGHDFIYDDDFSSSKVEYLASSSQEDFERKRLVANTIANGRFHSDWLTMMFARLRIARNLLKDDGVVFISIDDDEVGNLRKLCDEVFGESNFVANIIWEKKYSPQNDARYFSDMHDHILVYCKSKDDWKPIPLPRTADQDSAYTNPDNDPRGPWKATDATCNKTRAERPNLYYPIRNPAGDSVLPKETRVWAVSEELHQEREQQDRVWWGLRQTNAVPSYKTFLSEVKSGRVPTTIWSYEEVGHNQQAKQELNRLVPNSGFNTPKPSKLIAYALRIVSNPDDDDVIVDFFAGSAASAHAVISLNREDGGNRRFIMVQLPDPCREGDTASEGLETIADIGKQRIRSVGQLASEESTLVSSSLDHGFRVLKIDSSNMKDVYYSPADTSQAMLGGLVDNIKSDRSGEDLLFQVLLDCGVDLGLPIKAETIEGCEVFFVNDSEYAAPDLVACFDAEVPELLVKTIAAKSPLRAVFRDGCFATDADKINVEQIFKQMSPQTQLRSL
ncbi:putative methyltransferase [Rubripirellula lacrimiformis]|uniref:site-specific DNA-methyltransferase (adenine-specific) n=1 Tax=Rubripirellula lacrimiformis TaxID=1930273 RepID=A0A517NAR2_9BACT|nr:site-specific DNA-methyltransferase [Rubripirellula lacrimiformis]QDT04223.1 putative methyltransferase [Rubripirellula lacrimiformis]